VVLGVIRTDRSPHFSLVTSVSPDHPGDFMHYTYILRSLKDGKLYVGSTADIDRRLWRHNAGLVPATQHRRPLELVYHEAHDTRIAAVQRERYLKSLEGSREKARLVSRSVKKSGGDAEPK